MGLVDELATIYAGTDHADEVGAIAARLRTMLDDRPRPGKPRPASPGHSTTPWSQEDVWVIAYPDHFQDGARAPLAVMPEALDLLAPVYGWFTQGLKTTDLKTAKALLDELA